jgi:hypothetical protein
MQDLYKRLNVKVDASEEAIRDRLALVDGATRSAAETVLLDSRRRRVYDRNREVLSTIGHIRLSLRLNYTRFWARREYRDFWQDGIYAPPRSEPPKRGRKVDKIMIAQAFHSVRHHSRRHAARWGWAWLAVAGCTGVTLLAVILWIMMG